MVLHIRRVSRYPGISRALIAQSLNTQNCPEIMKGQMEKRVRILFDLVAKVSGKQDAEAVWHRVMALMGALNYALLFTENVKVHTGIDLHDEAQKEAYARSVFDMLFNASQGDPCG